jgi:hypothetical protein
MIQFGVQVDVCLCCFLEEAAFVVIAKKMGLTRNGPGLCWSRSAKAVAIVSSLSATKEECSKQAL